MKLRRIILTSVVVLAVMAACALIIRLDWIQETVRDGLITPVMYLVWLAGLALRAVDQNVLWLVGLLILGIALIYGLISAWPASRKEVQSHTWEDQHPPPESGRIDFWENRLRSLRSQGISSDYAMHDFRRLVRQVGEMTNQDFANNPQPFPDTIEPFLVRPKAQVSEIGSARRSWRQRLTGLFRPQQANGDISALPELCKFLEENLEIDHDEVH
jgi:hypothetical protein